MRHNIFVWAVAALSFLASCSDDEIVADVTFPAEIEQSQTNGLENYSYAIPFEVKSDSEWKIEFDEAGEEIAYAHPASGKGNATVKLYVLDNLTSEARQGTLTIVFPEDKSKNKVVTLKQKAKDGSDENFSKEAVGNIIYGVGYGFNVVTGVGARAVKAQIIKAQLLTEGNYVQRSATSSVSAEISTYTGSTVSELSNKFTNTLDFSWNGSWGMEAEANSKFDVNNYNKEEYQYAMSFVDVSKEQITITLNEDEWAYWNDLDEGCYTRAAYKAINGENKKYPSDNAGFKKLFDSYGTHVIGTATLGGRLTIATTVNTSDITQEYNLDAYAKLSYSGIFDVSNEVSDEYKNSYKANANACQTKISALGGTSSIFNDLDDLTGDGAKKATDTWFKSLNEDESSWTFIGLDSKENLIPLWDLVEDGERARLMQEYFESGQYAKDVNKGLVYDMGVQAHLPEGAPDFEVTGTKIYDVKVGENNNKTVARICYEYIPELDETAQVKVVYPDINGQVKWNMGWFVDNSYYTPRRVMNIGGKIKLEVIPNETKLGEASEIYIRGVHISSQSLDDEMPTQTTTVVPYYERMMRGNALGDYKVVKILNNIWMAENFAGTADINGNPLHEFDYMKHESNIEGVDDIYNYIASMFADYSDQTIMPAGWKYIKYTGSITEMDAILDIEEMLAKYEVNVVKAFSIGGCLGFNAVYSGYCNEVFKDYKRTCVHVDDGKFYMMTGYKPYHGENSAYQVWTYCISPANDSYSIHHLYGDMLRGDEFGDIYGWKASVFVPIRFYKPIQ